MPAWMPSSVNVPSSSSRSSRSRAVSFSCACWRAIRSSPPPSLALARRSCRSSTRGRSIGAATYRPCRASEPSSSTCSPRCSTRGRCGATWPATHELGARWRRKSLEIIYATGPYRPYDEIVVEAAGERAAESCSAAGTSSSRGPRRRPSCATSQAITASRSSRTPRRTSRSVRPRSSGSRSHLLVSAEAVGFYKPRPEPYSSRHRSGPPALFVAAGRRRARR